MRILYALLLAPLLLAPVRLKDSTPSFFTPPSESPDPEAVSLPAADALTSPTVIPVSPTILQALTVTVPPSSSLNLPLPPSPTAPVIQKVIVIQQPENLMSPLSSALCQKGMALVQNMAMLSYEQQARQATMTLAIAASAASAEAATRHWPNLAGYNKAERKLPWFFLPDKAELKDAIAAARNLCQQ